MEVALALGIVGFALVGLIGAIPLAANVGQQSITQSRAASIASTIFTNFRNSPFGNAPYLDAAPGADPSTAATVSLDIKTTGDSLTYFAYFDEVTTSAPSPTTDTRRLHFVSTAPTGVPVYQITLRFNNHPAGTLAPYSTGSAGASTTHAQANSIEVSVAALAHPGDVYRFSSVVANRSE